MTSKDETKQALLKTDEQSRAAFYDQTIKSGLVRCEHGCTRHP